MIGGRPKALDLVKRQLAVKLYTDYGVSTDTLYRSLRQNSRPKALNRADSGTPRKLALPEMELYCQVIAAFKIRTCNKKDGVTIENT
jgi:hypothetical protein